MAKSNAELQKEKRAKEKALLDRIAADFETQVTMLRGVKTPIVVTEKVSRLIEAAGRKSLAADPPEPEDEIEIPK